MASNLDNLKAYWSGAVTTAFSAGDIDEPTKLEALVRLDTWIASESAAATAAATDLSGYSIGGRSVSRKATSDARAAAASSMRAFFELLGGFVTHADFRDAGIGEHPGGFR